MCFGCCDQSGSKHLNFLEFSNSDGDGRLWFKGAVMYDRIAKCKSSPPSITLVRLFFTVSTNLSAWQLDCALVGNVILWSMCQSLLKSLNSCDVNCVPPSETIHLGIPTVVKISFKILITLNEWRLQFSNNGKPTEIVNC